MQSGPSRPRPGPPAPAAAAALRARGPLTSTLITQPLARTVLILFEVWRAGGRRGCESKV